MQSSLFPQYDPEPQIPAAPQPQTEPLFELPEGAVKPAPRDYGQPVEPVREVRPPAVLEDIEFALPDRDSGALALTVRVAD